MSHSSHSRKKAHPVITAFLITAAILILLAVSIAISWEHIYNVRKMQQRPMIIPVVSGKVRIRSLNWRYPMIPGI